jgi:hypothetical protein
MPYIGKSPVGGGFHKLDNLTASATDTYALTLGSAAYYPETANQLLVSLNGVIQAPQDSFTVSGSNLVFDSALTASDSIDFVVALGDVLGVQGVTDGAVTTAKIANQAVTMNKLATSGTLPALDGSNLTGVGVAGISSSSTSGTALSVDANNIVTTPARPAFRVEKTSTTTLTGGTLTTVDFDTADFNIGNAFNLSTDTFTAPVSGVYFFSANLSYYDNGDSRQIEGRFLVNGSQKQIADGFIQQTSGNNTHMTITLTALFNLNANDTVFVQTVSVGTVNFYSGGGRIFFSGHLVG